MLFASEDSRSSVPTRITLAWNPARVSRNNSSKRIGFRRRSFPSAQRLPMHMRFSSGQNIRSSSKRMDWLRAKVSLSPSALLQRELRYVSSWNRRPSAKRARSWSLKNFSSARKHRFTFLPMVWISSRWSRPRITNGASMATLVRTPEAWGHIRSTRFCRANNRMRC